MLGDTATNAAKVEGGVITCKNTGAPRCRAPHLAVKLDIRMDDNMSSMDFLKF